MSKNPSRPSEGNENPVQPATRSRRYDGYRYTTIFNTLESLKNLKPKYDKSIFEIKQEQEQVFSESPFRDPVAEVKGLGPPESPTAVDRQEDFEPVKTGSLSPVGAKEKAKAAQQASLKEYQEKQYQEKLTEIISRMEALAAEAEKIDASDIQKQIELIGKISIDSIEDLPGLGYNEDTILFLSQKYMKLMEQYEYQVKKMEESAEKAKSAQEELKEERENDIIENMKKVHNGLANAAASAGIDDLEPYDIAVLWEKGNTEVIVNALQQRIDEFKREIEKEKERMIKEKKDKVIEDLKNIEENFEKLRRKVEELNVVKENGKKIQEAIENNYDNLLQTRKKIEDINVQSKLDELMEKSDEMEKAIRERVKQIEEEEYSIDGEEKEQKAMKECNNEYFLNLKNATVNHIKLTIDKLKGEGIKNIKNEDIKARIYGIIKNRTNKDNSTDLNFYLFLNIVDFLLFMINPPEYKKKDKKLHYKKKPFNKKGINEIINKEAEKLENVKLLFQFIRRRRDLRDIDENWLCENINS